MPNVVKVLDFAKTNIELLKDLLQVAETLGFEGGIKLHVDKILNEVTKNKTINDPLISDMVL